MKSEFTCLPMSYDVATSKRSSVEYQIKTILKYIVSNIDKVLLKNSFFVIEKVSD